MDRKDFAERLSQLRINKGVSARDMSLSIGQSQNYITSIESGRNLPSMTVFFYICEYLGITPKQFFDAELTDPLGTSELENAAKGIAKDDMDHLIAIVKKIKR